MILAVAATEFEMGPLTGLLSEEKGQRGDGPAWPCRPLISGVGPVETALRLTRYLERCEPPVEAILNFGVAGAYLPDDSFSSSAASGQAEILDLCLAERECFGDFGLCYSDHIEAFAPQLGGPVVFTLDQTLLDQAAQILARRQIHFRRGTFVTVSAASATRKRGAMLAARFQGLCENMEGAAVARVCAEFSLPLLELRAISNLVEDRDPGRWQMAAACQRAAAAVAIILSEIQQ